MAASALSEEISERQAGALAVLAGVGDDRLSELFAGSRGVALRGRRLATWGQDLRRDRPARAVNGQASGVSALPRTPGDIRG